MLAILPVLFFISILGQDDLLLLLDSVLCLLSIAALDASLSDIRFSMLIYTVIIPSVLFNYSKSPLIFTALSLLNKEYYQNIFTITCSFDCHLNVAYFDSF